MTIQDIINELKLHVFTGAEKTGNTVKGAYASDLLSDVMGRAKEGDVWITMQTHKNILAVATLKEIAAIIIVNGSKPEDRTIEAAVQENLVVLGSGDSSFTICGKLFKLMERNAVV